MISISAFRTLMKDPRSLISTGSPNGATRVTSKRVLGRTPKEKSFFPIFSVSRQKTFHDTSLSGFHIAKLHDVLLLENANNFYFCRDTSIYSDSGVTYGKEKRAVLCGGDHGSHAADV